VKQNEPRWFFAQHLDHLLAAREWGIDADRWEEMTDQGRGLVVAAHRAQRTMQAYEEYIFRKK
jgi:hypothetical protein